APVGTATSIVFSTTLPATLTVLPTTALPTETAAPPTAATALAAVLATLTTAQPGSSKPSAATTPRAAARRQGHREGRGCEVSMRKIVSQRPGPEDDFESKRVASMQQSVTRAALSRARRRA